MPKEKLIEKSYSYEVEFNPDENPIHSLVNPFQTCLELEENEEEGDTPLKQKA